MYSIEDHGRMHLNGNDDASSGGGRPLTPDLTEY